MRFRCKGTDRELDLLGNPPGLNQTNPFMPHPKLPKAESRSTGLLAKLFCLVVLLLPVTLMTIGIFRVTGGTQNLLRVGVVLQTLGCVLVLVARRGSSPVLGAR